MEPPLSTVVNREKFMWDGIVYDSESAARDTAAGYEKDTFETTVMADGGKWLVYSRRVAQATAAAQ